jgi:hypothetical protein
MKNFLNLKKQKQVFGLIKEILFWIIFIEKIDPIEKSSR